MRPMLINCRNHAAYSREEARGRKGKRMMGLYGIFTYSLTKVSILQINSFELVYFMPIKLIKDNVENSRKGFMRIYPVIPVIILVLFMAGNSDVAEPSQSVVIASHFTKALELSSKGAYEEAIPLLNHLINQNSADVKAYISRGMAFYQLGEYERSLTDFRKAVFLKPSLGIGHQFEGITLYVLGKLDQAILAFDRALERNPELGLSYYTRGIIFLQKGSEANALNDFRKAQALGVQVASGLIDKASFVRTDGAQNKIGFSDYHVPLSSQYLTLPWDTI